MARCPWCDKDIYFEILTAETDEVEPFDLEGSETVSGDCPHCGGLVALRVDWETAFEVARVEKRQPDPDRGEIEPPEPAGEVLAERFLTPPDQLEVPGTCRCGRCGRDVLDGRFAPHKLTAAALMEAGWRVVNEFPMPLVTCPVCAGTRPPRAGLDPQTTEARA